MTGAGTASADNPRLNVRASDSLAMADIRQPLRVVLSSDFSLALDAAMLQLPGQVAVIGCQDNEQAAKLRAAGVVTGVVAAAEDSDRVNLTAAMQWLAAQQVNELHVECGPTLAGSLVQAGLVDELLIYQANSLLGDRGLPMLTLPQIGSIEQQLRLPPAQQKFCGDDRRLLYTLTTLDELHDDVAVMLAQRGNNELDTTIPSPIGATCLPD
jgi:diaminohydroxyphosphoribosylaminopyrimidine deaminase/5-amino-6-(5-phosphoribosylamino)uracil reductase